MSKFTQLKLRIPAMTQFTPELHKRLVKEARLNGRSLNGEIIHRLETSFMTSDLVGAVREAVTASLAKHGNGAGIEK
jgi:hypothetical protein